MPSKIVFIFLTVLCFVLNSESLKFSSLDVVYKKGIDAYNKERWSECILQFEGALHLYKVYKSININCRLKCKSKDYTPVHKDNIEELNIFEYFLHINNCLSQCQKNEFESVQMYSNVSNTILNNMLTLKPYAYLHLCYYEMYALPKAASSAYTYHVAHIDDADMKRNVDYYIKQPEVDVKEVINLESKDYEVLFKLGKEAYLANKWAETIANMEETLTDYLTWENTCRAECEYQSENLWSPEFTVTVANNILSILLCRQKCQENLKPMYDTGVEFLADVLNYLQISYYRLDRHEDAAKAVASYLHLYPTDDDMLENKYIYLTITDKSSFSEKSDIVHYLKRDKYEKDLLNFFLNKDNNIVFANTV